MRHIEPFIFFSRYSAFFNFRESPGPQKTARCQHANIIDQDARMQDVRVMNRPPQTAARFEIFSENRNRPMLSVKGLHLAKFRLSVDSIDLRKGH